MTVEPTKGANCFSVDKDIANRIKAIFGVLVFDCQQNYQKATVQMKIKLRINFFNVNYDMAHSEACISQIKVTINRLKLSFTRYVGIKPCLTQNLSLVPFFIFGDMMSLTFPSQEGKESSNSDLYPLQMVLTSENEFLCLESFFMTQNLPPYQFQQLSNDIFSFSKFWGVFDEKKGAATPLAV